MIYSDKYYAVDGELKQRVPGSRTFVEKKTPFVGTENAGFQGTWVELTTFVGTGQKKHRFDFAWPEKLWEDLSADEIIALVERAIRLESV